MWRPITISIAQENELTAQYSETRRQAKKEEEGTVIMRGWAIMVARRKKDVSI